MKKFLSMLVVAAVLMAGVVGCGGGATTAPKPAKDAPAKDAPAKDAPAKDAPAKDAPAKDKPAGM